MDAERARAILLKLPHVEETRQWGDNLVFWIGKKTQGGKMFCLLDLDGHRHGVISFAAGPERFAELIEQEGFKPAPYLARAYWVAAEHWNALRPSAWEEQFQQSHQTVYTRLQKRVREALASSEVPGNKLRTRSRQSSPQQPS